MYASWELIGLCSFLLVGFWYTQREAAAGARKVLVMTHIAGYALLAAILILYVRTGATVWTDPRVGPAFTTGLFALMLVASFAKSVQFPLHTWIPSAMAAPTPVSALLHAACYVKAGVYLVARMHSFTPWPVGWQTTVVWLGTATMVIGVLFAMVQHDAKRLLAFHTVSQIGYMMLGLGLGTPLGIIAALLHCLNHGLFKGGLFLGAGAVQHATGTRDMDKLGGLARRTCRGTTVLWLISAASIAGRAALQRLREQVAAVRGRAGRRLPRAGAARVDRQRLHDVLVHEGEQWDVLRRARPRRPPSAHESPRTMLAGGAVLATLCVVLGVAPQLAIDGVIAPALRSMHLTSDLQVSWLGLSAVGASWYATAGLVLALVAVAGGFLLYRLTARRPRPALAAAGVSAPEALGRRPRGAGGPAATALAPLAAVAVGAGSAPFTGGEPLRPHTRLHASDFSVTIRHALSPFYEWADPDRYYLVLWRGTLRVCAVAARAGEWLERRALAALPLLALAVAIVAGLGAGQAGRAVGAPPVAVWPLTAAVGRLRGRARPGRLRRRTAAPLRLARRSDRRPRHHRARDRARPRPPPDARSRCRSRIRAAAARRRGTRPPAPPTWSRSCSPPARSSPARSCSTPVRTPSSSPCSWPASPSSWRSCPRISGCLLSPSALRPCSWAS